MACCSAFAKKQVYSVFCANQDQSLKLLTELQARNARFASWLQHNQTKFLSRGLDLQAFLVKPIQRVCKYPLFLREMMDNSPSDEATAELQVSRLRRAVCVCVCVCVL